MHFDIKTTRLLMGKHEATYNNYIIHNIISNKHIGAYRTCYDIKIIRNQFLQKYYIKM